MKILLLGNAYFRGELEEQGHQVLLCTSNPSRPQDVPKGPLPVDIHQVLAALPSGWQPDLIFLGDDSKFPQFLGLEFLDIPLAWYAIDSHRHPWHRDYAAAFDLIFVAQKDYLNRYRQDSARPVVAWLPLFCRPERDRVLNLPKTHDLAFVGTLDPLLHPERVRLIEEIKKHFPLYAAGGDYVPIFNAAKLVLNQCSFNDLNFRTFQALGCGSFLLMENIGNGLSELFQDKVHLALYAKGNVAQILELTHYYLAHEAEREEIAAQGHAAVMQAHTARHRVAAILDAIQGQDVSDLVKRRQARLPDIALKLATAYVRIVNAYETFERSHPHLISRDSATAKEMYNYLATNTLKGWGG
ncbi:MAG: glycosyltransferase [Thermodesulfobacteriota bacterium]